MTDTVQRRAIPRQQRAEALREILTELGGDATTREIAARAVERGLFDSSMSRRSMYRAIERALSADNPATGVPFAITLPKARA